jgi:hypothetical protein
MTLGDGSGKRYGRSTMSGASDTPTTISLATSLLPLHLDPLGRRQRDDRRRAWIYDEANPTRLSPDGDGPVCLLTPLLAATMVSSDGTGRSGNNHLARDQSRLRAKRRATDAKLLASTQDQSAVKRDTDGGGVSGMAWRTPEPPGPGPIQGGRIGSEAERSTRRSN